LPQLHATLSFNVTNLLVPEDPKTLVVEVPSGAWNLEQLVVFPDLKRYIDQGMCA
jgi:hypothetical protein